MGFSFEAKYEIYEEGPGILLYTLPFYSFSLSDGDYLVLDSIHYKIEKVVHYFESTGGGPGGLGFGQPITKVEVSVVP